MTYDFYSGVTVAGYWVVTLFFLRFRQRTGERVFTWFAAGFFVLGVQPLANCLLAGHIEDEAELYLLRLIGFSLIIAGIAVANRRRRLSPEPGQE